MQHGLSEHHLNSYEDWLIDWLNLLGHGEPCGQKKEYNNQIQK